MTVIESPPSIDDVVARAEEFMRSGLLRATRCGPKREGKGRNRGKGQAFEWLCRHVTYDEKKCLFWPFSKNYGRPSLFGYCGKTYKPTRTMCMLAHGAPPSDQHRAAHTCSGGNRGCIHPKHLAWKTVSECRLDEYRDGRRKNYGRGGRLTPSEAAEIRTLGKTKTATEIAKIKGHSLQTICEILRGTAYVTPRTFNQKDGKFYPRLGVGRRSYYLGVCSSVEQAAAAYEAARMRVRLGEPVLLPKKERPSLDDIRRWHRAPSEKLKFGDREGEAVIEVAPEQEQSVLISHHALSKLHPKVQKFILFAGSTGDPAEAAELAGISKEQVSMLLPRLRAFLGSLVDRPIL